MPGGFALYLAFVIPPMLLGLAVQAWLRSTVARYAADANDTGLSGAEVARRILDRNGLHEVPIQQAPGGPLSDHYDPRSRSVHLSETVYAQRSVTAAAIAAHEVGHAIQHQRRFAPMQLRSAMFPAVSLASNAWMFLLIGGAVTGALGLVKVGIALFAVAVLFHIVTLPVEFDASRRAMNQLRELGLVGAGETAGARKVLTAAAMTYVAGALAAIAQLAYFAMVFLGNNRD